MDKNFEVFDVYTRILETDSHIKQGIIAKQYFAIQHLNHKSRKNFIGGIIIGCMLTILIAPALVNDKQTTHSKQERV